MGNGAVRPTVTTLTGGLHPGLIAKVNIDLPSRRLVAERPLAILAPLGLDVGLQLVRLTEEAAGAAVLWAFALVVHGLKAGSFTACRAAAMARSARIAASTGER